MSKSHSRLWLLSITAAVLATAPPILRADEPVRDARPFRIVVVDEETGRGVPLVELRTVNHIRYVTDSNGVVAFNEPGLMDQKVFFWIKSHGYEYPKDGFGFAGTAVDVAPGGEARLKIKRVNIARRLYRITGQGIYRDSLLTGVPTPIREPVLNGQVLGQDSAMNAVFQGKLHWFWGDTSRPSYPLGNFHMPGAVSDLPDRGGLDPSKGVDLTYYADENGFARPTCEMPGEGPTWIGGLIVLKDDQGRERMFANYAKIKPPMTVYERGSVEFDPEKNEFVKRLEFGGEAGDEGEDLVGHTFLHRDGDAEYVYYCTPYPLVRVPADPEKIIDADNREVFTCLKPGTKADEAALDRDADGRLRFAWRRDARILSQRDQAELVKKGELKPEEGLIQLRDVATGETVVAHGGSVYWNDYRKSWVMIAVELGGTSFLGEVWFAEADSPLGPWVFARKVVTHDDYTFYNPKQHPMFDQEGGRLIYFEGTYVTTFSGSKDPTPRYDYNQVMYQLDLADARLALPRPVYRLDDDEAPGGLALAPALSGGPSGRTIAFFAPDRPSEEATVAVVEIDNGAGGSALAIASKDQPDAGKPRFFLLPSGSRLAETEPIYEYSREEDGRRTFGFDSEPGLSDYRRSPDPVGRAWRNPGPAHVW